jgi:hypothetical protein
VRSRLAWCFGLMLIEAACGGDGVISTVVGPPPPPAPTLTELQSSIFSPRCGVPGCHAPPSPEQGMNLTAGNTYAFTVGVDAVELSEFKRVAPRNAKDSYLYMKVAGDPRITGFRMPFGGMLTDAEIAEIGAWIDAGALDN